VVIKKGKNKADPLKILALLAVYIFISISHIFLLPSYTTQNNTGSKSGGKYVSMLIQQHNYLTRTDQAVFKENKPVIAMAAMMIFSWLVASLLVAGRNIISWQVMPAITLRQPPIYLLLRIFRI